MVRQVCVHAARCSCTLPKYPCARFRPRNGARSAHRRTSCGSRNLHPTTPCHGRDLGLAGRVLVRDKAAAASTSDSALGSGLTHRLVKIDRPILRIPMLAIHLQRDIHTAGFKPNLQVGGRPQLEDSCGVAARRECLCME